MSSGSYCSPKNKNKFTCFSNSDLVKIAKYITKQSGGKIIIPKKFTSDSRKKLWLDIKQNIGNLSKCKEDYCMINNNTIGELLGKNNIEKIFRPEKPIAWLENKTTWLSTVDIRKVMLQYQDKHKDFKFIGPTPIDFDKRFTKDLCVNNELCNFNLESLLKKGKTKIGIVFNLDPHNMSGSHWVSMYIDVHTGGIYFFCSYGVKPNNYIQILMQRIFNQGNSLIEKNKLDVNQMTDQHTIARKYKIIDRHTIKVEDGQLFFKNMLIFFGNMHNDNLIIDKSTLNKIQNVDNNIITTEYPIDTENVDFDLIIMKCFRPFYNDIRFQFKNTECGVYSIYFIESFLKGNTHDEILSNIIKDNEMNTRRNIYYRPNIS